MRRIRFEYIIVPLLAGIVAAASFWFVADQYAEWPEYQATATLLIERTPDSGQVGMSSQGIAIAQSTLSALMVRQPLIGSVIERSGIDLTPGELAERISVSSPNDAPILEVRITDSDPAEAATLANSIAFEAASMESSLVAVSVLSEAVEPTFPTLNSYILVVIAGIVGAQLGVAAVALVRRMSSVIRSADDVRERSDFALLGELELGTTDRRRVASTDRIVVAAYASSLPPGRNALLIVSPVETDRVDRMADLLADVIGKLRGFDRVYRDEVRSVAGEDDADGGIEAVAVTTHRSDVGPPMELRSWIDTALVRPDPIEDDEASSAEGTTRQATAVDQQMRIIAGPPLLNNLEIVLGVAEQSSTVLIIERNVTKIRDFELAVDFLNRSGAKVSGIFLIG